MTVQENALQAYYASLTDAELLKLAANRSSFIDAAQQAMSREMLRRHLEMPAGPLPAEPQTHGLGAMVKRLAGILPGQRK